MLDRICRRYPGRRPSDYLGLDEWNGYLLDRAMAFRYDIRDMESRTAELTAIMESINNVCRAQGAKVEKITLKPTKLKYPDDDILPTVEEVLAQLGGIGVVLNKGIGKKE